MIFGDLKTVLVATGALVIGLIAGNMRGELIGYGNGYAACQEANRQATRDANARALAEQDKLLPEEYFRHITSQLLYRYLNLCRL